MEVVITTQMKIEVRQERLVYWKEKLDLYSSKNKKQMAEMCVMMINSLIKEIDNLKSLKNG